MDILLVHVAQPMKQRIYATLTTPAIHISEADHTPLAVRMLESTPRPLFVIIDFRLSEWWKFDEFFQYLAQRPLLVKRHAFLLLVATQETIPIRLGSMLSRLPVTLAAKPLNPDALHYAYNHAMRHMRDMIASQQTHKRYS